MSSAFDTALARHAEAIEAALGGLLPQPAGPQARLHEAMRYAALGGGKRLRPFLVAAGGAIFDVPEQQASRVGSAIELIHCYSLVHDDLPAMDDAETRRGRPSCHRQFDEATAILVGDALLSEGLLLLARHPTGAEWAPHRAVAVELVAEAVSSRGMVGGQMDDLEATGQVVGEEIEPEARLERIHRHKTGCLLAAAVEVGAALAGLDSAARRPFARFGACLGLAFQVADDILDATATAAELGKSPGKDATAGKLTYVTLYGLDAARGRLDELEQEMLALATGLEGAGGSLATLARFVAERRS
jgi:farnesyl diphosphate synthase